MDYTEKQGLDENSSVDAPPKPQNESSKAASPAEASSSQNNEFKQQQKQQPSKEELEKKITEMKKLIDSQRKLQSDIMRDLDTQKHQIDLNSNEKPQAKNQTKNGGSEQGPLSSNQIDESSEIREDQAIETPIGASQLFNESPLADDYEVADCDALPTQSEHVPIQN